MSTPYGTPRRRAMMLAAGSSWKTSRERGRASLLNDFVALLSVVRVATHEADDRSCLWVGQGWRALHDCAYRGDELELRLRARDERSDATDPTYPAHPAAILLAVHAGQVRLPKRSRCWLPASQLCLPGATIGPHSGGVDGQDDVHSAQHDIRLSAVRECKYDPRQERTLRLLCAAISADN